MKTEEELIWESYTIENKIKNFIKEYSGRGFAGDCGKFAIALNKYLGGVGEYVAAINTQIWELGEYWLGHVVLKVDNKLYDIDGEITDIERLRSWGMIDPEDSTAELYNLSEEECYEAEVINLSELWGQNVEEKILDNTCEL
jgi:hypothetical protein